MRLLWVSDASCYATVDAAVQHYCRVLEKAKVGAELLPTRASNVHLAMREGAVNFPALLASQECLLIIFDELAEMGADTSQVVDDARDVGVPAIFVQPIRTSLMKAQAVRFLREAAGSDQWVFTYETDAVSEAVEAALLRAVSTPVLRAGASSPLLKEFPST